MSEKYDFNADGISEPSDWLKEAIRQTEDSIPRYKSKGEYNESHPELTLSNLDTILQLNKRIILEITTTDCNACKSLEIILKDVSSTNGEEIKVVKLTHGNPEFDEILKRLGIEDKRGGFPKVYIREAGTEEFSLQDDNYYLEGFTGPKEEPTEPVANESSDEVVEIKDVTVEQEDGDDKGAGVRMLAGAKVFVKPDLIRLPSFNTGIEVVSSRSIMNMFGQIDLVHSYLFEEIKNTKKHFYNIEHSTSLRAELGANGGPIRLSGFLERDFDPGITSMGAMFGGGLFNHRGPFTIGFQIGGGTSKKDTERAWKPGMVAILGLQFATPYFGDSYDLENWKMYPTR